MSKRVRIHDGIIGALLGLSALLTALVDVRFLWLGAATGAVMLQSAFTGFCPVHFALGRLIAPSARDDV
ncbi:MAG: DUF2892 domain-containing protein [Polyangiaceae bacterium]